MNLLRSHWFWFFAIMTLVSGLDYYDHIARPGSSFEAAPGAWLGFTLASMGSVCVIAYGIARMLQKLPMPAIAADTLGVMSGFAAHLLVTGPLWDRVFWDGMLMFHGNWVPMLAAGVLYLFYRGLFRFITMLRASEPPSRA